MPKQFQSNPTLGQEYRPGYQVFWAAHDGRFNPHQPISGSFQILVRWTLPRFRWDQLMRFAWKGLLPVAILNLVVTVFAVWAVG